MSLFKLGKFLSHSNNVLPWKVECDSLDEEDWNCLAFLMNEKLESLNLSFGKVEGVPSGGLKLEKALAHILI